ncbi:MAG: alpha/beta fold hydrolase [Qingshengfaniella sp.]
MLAHTIHGDPGQGRPLIIAHGLFGSGRNWGAIAKQLADTRPVVTVDMRNHGASDWSDRHDYEAMAGDLAEVIATLGSPADVLGHSMGGKTAMVLALTHPGHVARLMVADIAPVAYTHTQMHNLNALRAVDLTRVKTRRDADAQLQDSVPDPMTRAFFLQSLDVKAGRWRLNLDVLAREMDKILGFPEITDPYDGPALFLSGALSDYVQRTDRDRIKALFPKAVFVKIPGAGHWLHAEKPQEVTAALQVFLDKTEARA